MTKTRIIYFLFLIITLNLLYGQDKVNLEKNRKIEIEAKKNNVDVKEKLYKKMSLEEKISYETFETAFLGYEKIDKSENKLLTIVDFSKPSNVERFFVLNLEDEEILYSTYVAHGMKSGELMAVSFSNTSKSKKSSPGFYITENIYNGKNGYSMRLEGLEKGINDNAKKRLIVVHGAAYANPNPNGYRLGRSFGCLTLPTKINKEVVDAIKDGSVLYIHTNNPEYKNKSNFLKTTNI